MPALPHSSLGSDTCNGTTLAPGKACAVSVAFSTATPGMLAGSLSVADGPSDTVLLPLTAFVQAIPSGLSFMPSSLDFMDVTVGAPAGPTPVTVTNTGGIPTSALGTSLSGANASDFAIGSDMCNGQTLAAGATCTLAITLTPSGLGARAASLDISGAQATASMPLAGTGEEVVTLTVKKNGTGTGTVSGDTINCGSTCTEPLTLTSTSYPMVALTATPDPNSTFTGWSGGGCSGTANPCAVTMDAAQTVTASFALNQYPLHFSLQYFGASSTGKVTSVPAGVSCSGPCKASPVYNAGTSVTLTASSAAPQFHWGGDCSASGTSTTCTLAMTQARTVTMTVNYFNYVFVTSNNTFTGNLGGLSGADATCTAASTAAGLPGTYKAFLSTTTTSAASRLGSARGWIRVDGLPFTDTVADMAAGQVYYPIGVTELGTASTGTAWTATNGDGTFGGATSDCLDWTSASASDSGTGGAATGGSGGFTEDFGTQCNSTESLYCFGVSLTHPLAYTLATGRYAFLSKGSFDTSTGQAGADAMCASEATAGSLPGTYLALLATDTATAASRFNLAGLNWVRKDGIPVATSPTQLMGGNLLTSISQYADGTYINYSNIVRTGAISATTVGTDSEDCVNWTSNASSAESVVGISSFTFANSDFIWLSQACNQTAAVYCLEK